MEYTVPRGYYEQYMHALARVAKSRQSAVKDLVSKAQGYVWGWQDNGGAMKDSGEAMDFMYAYGTVVAEFEGEQSFSLMPIQDAWQSWQRLRRIDRDWYLY